MSKIFQPYEVELIYVFDSGEKDSLTVEDQIRCAYLSDPESGADVEVSTVIIGGAEYDPDDVVVKWETDSGEHQIMQSVQGNLELEAPNGELYYPVEVRVG